MAWTYFPLSTTPAPYDIVWCRFPYVEDPGLPGPKARPALVKQAFATAETEPWVDVVYGTSQAKFRDPVNCFSIANMAELAVCGLYRPTRFDLDRVVKVPWCEEFFEPVSYRYTTPVLGRLSPHLVRLLQVQAAYLQQRRQKAEPDLFKPAEEPQAPQSDPSSSG